MEETQSRAHLKRPLPVDDDDSEKPPAQKRVRFPKGKKVTPGNEKLDVSKLTEKDMSWQPDPRLAAKERAMRRTELSMQRNKISADLFRDENRGISSDISTAEVKYENNEVEDDDGNEMDPFNLDKEREEGYFDEQGNFVEYTNDNEIKDAWLDSVEVDPKLAAKVSLLTSNEDDDIHELSSQEIGKMKRRIADVLEPGETVLQALRRLKGNVNNKKEKMSAEAKLLFEQLTEDAMKLMENGDYNVYEEKREVFQRESEGYEMLMRARGEGTSMDLGEGKSHSTVANDFISSGTDIIGASSMLSDVAVGSSNLNVSAAENLPGDGDDTFDMFAEDDENIPPNPTSEENNLVSGPNHDRVGQPSENGGSHNDYVYDESSGYYYSSSLGYYYEPSSGMYCCAASGQWYVYNEATGAYDEVQETAPEAS